MYALGGEKAAEIAPLVEPIEPQLFVLATPPRSLFGKGLEEWRAKQQEEINAEITRQVEAGRSARGFLLSTASPITPATPLARVQRFLELGRQLGA